MTPPIVLRQGYVLQPHVLAHLGLSAPLRQHAAYLHSKQTKYISKALKNAELLFKGELTQS